ncbi:MAG: hypothetical protein WC465_00545 [Patescibacteria group bacterium]
MPNFSKFLPTEEGLDLLIYPKEAAYKLYLWLLFLLVAFFMMYPLWHLGRPGIFLWLTMTAFILLAIANHFLRRFSYYILSTNKLWHVFYIKADNIRIRGSIDRGLIIALEKCGDHDILVLTKQNRYYLKDIKQRDQVYAALVTKLNIAAYQKDVNLL